MNEENPNNHYSKTHGSAFVMQVSNFWFYAI